MPARKRAVSFGDAFSAARSGATATKNKPAAVAAIIVLR
jgi:hypothetical protein